MIFNSNEKKIPILHLTCWFQGKTNLWRGGAWRVEEKKPQNNDKTNHTLFQPPLGSSHQEGSWIRIGFLPFLSARVCVPDPNQDSQVRRKIGGGGGLRLLEAGVRNLLSYMCFFSLSTIRCTWGFSTSLAHQLALIIFYSPKNECLELQGRHPNVCGWPEASKDHIWSLLALTLYTIPSSVSILAEVWSLCWICSIPHSSIMPFYRSYLMLWSLWLPYGGIKT